MLSKMENIEVYKDEKGRTIGARKISGKKTLSQYLHDLESVMFEIDNADEITPELIKKFEEAQSDLKGKCDNWLGIFDALAAQETVLKAKKEAIDKEYQKNQNMQKRLKEYLRYQMEQNPERKFEGSEEKFVLQKNSVKRLDFAYERSTSSVETVPDYIVSLDDRVLEYCKNVELRVLDTARLKKDLEAGKTVPFAALVQGNHIRRKVL
jgi:hypothetical protein